MPLKIVEFFQFGGVDSRSNALNMPQDRGLYARNFLLRPDKSLRLRDGYTDIGAGSGTGAAHSEVGYKLLNGDRYVIYAQGAHLYRRDLQTGVVDEPTVKGKALTGTGVWSWYLAFNRLHGTNGVDQKFFDGTVWRDIGIRAMTAAEVLNVSVVQGLRELTSAEANAVTLTPAAGGASPATTLGGQQYFCALFDPTTQTLGPSTIPLASGTRINVTLNQKVTVGNLPNFSATNPNVVKLFAATQDGGSNAYFAFVDGTDILPTAVSRTANLVTVTTGAAHGRSTGDVIVMNNISPDETGAPNGIFSITVTSATTFTYPSIGPDRSYGGITPAAFAQLVTASSAATSTDILNTSILASGLDPIANDTGMGLPATSVGGAQPGYQFYAALYNRSTGHVGNRVKIGPRLANTARATVGITGLPNLSGDDSELDIIIGRTSDGAEVPYAVTDIQGNWVWVPHGQTSCQITTSSFDGSAELPTRNTPPPANLSKVARVGDYVYGIVSDGPWVYRTPVGADAIDSYIPDANYPSIGRAEQSWPADNIETFPTGDIPVGNHGYNGDCWVQTNEDLAILIDQQGTPGWQGPWPGMGIAGPDAFCAGWKGLPYWITGHKQLATMTADGPIAISDEYEASLLARIGDAYLSSTQIVAYRDVEKQLEILVIKGRDSSGNPFLVFHDFNARDDRSAYGQATDATFGGPLASDFYLAALRDNNSRARIWAGASDGHLYQLFDGLTDAGSEFTADMIVLAYIGPDRTVVPIIEWYGDKNVEWYISGVLDKTINDLDKFTAIRTLDEDADTVPGDESNPHYRVELDDPELVHAYLWIRLTSHSTDAPENGMGLNDPPHLPLEVYGRILAVSPLIGTSRGK
jgi:hypothetical protein